MIWRRGAKRRLRFRRELSDMLRTAGPLDVGYISSMLLYVDIGRDRYRLPEDYVENVRRHLAERP